MRTPRLRVVELYDDLGTTRILLDEGQDFERFYREFAAQDAAYDAGEIREDEHLNFEQFAAARGIRVIDPVARDKLENFYGPDQGGEQPSVRCQFCGRTVPRSTSHLHGNGWVGDCCWDERLRSGEENDEPHPDLRPPTKEN